MPSPDLPAALARLEDRAAITDLILEFARCIDDSDQSGYAATFDEQCELVLPFAHLEGRAAIEAMPPPQPGMRTHHQLANIQITLGGTPDGDSSGDGTLTGSGAAGGAGALTGSGAGDSAHSRAWVTATHVFDAARPTDIAQAGGWYEHDLIRTPSGWRFRRVALTIVWHTPEPMLRDTPPTP